MKKLLIGTLFFFILTGIILVFVYINNNHYTLWNTNTISVYTGKSYNPDKVKIQFGESACTFIKDNDSYLFKSNSRFYTVYEKGNPQCAIENVYGENDFLLIYDNRYYLSFRHFKLNCNPQHDYRFGFYWKEDGLTAKIKIEGAFPLEFEHRMIPIDSASYYDHNELIKIL